MNRLPERVQIPSWTSRFRTLCYNSLNFYRVHLLAFTIIPLFFSGIMYGINTEYHIAYIDCLFCCMSAMTVTGLATIDLSTLSAMQQVILFWQMIIGSLTFVSIIMISVRQHFFRAKFRHVIQERQGRMFTLPQTFSFMTTGPRNIKHKLSTVLGASKDQPTSNGHAGGKHDSLHSFTEMDTVEPSLRKPNQKGKQKGFKKDIRKEMIKRVEGGGVGLINPMGWYDATGGEKPVDRRLNELQLSRGDTPSGSGRNSPSISDLPQGDIAFAEMGGHRSTTFAESPAEIDPNEPNDTSHSKTPYAGKVLSDDAFPRSRTIAFDQGAEGHDFEDHDAALTTAREGSYFPRTITNRSGDGQFPRTTTSSHFPRTYSIRPTSSRRAETRLRGFGGFPTPFQLLRDGFRKAFPDTSRTLTQSVTMPRVNTLAGRGSVYGDGGAKEVPYISFSATVGRNSHFTGLTQEQLDELGGVEYRALRVLFWIVVSYFVFVQLAAFVIITPYMSAGGRYDADFRNQPRAVSIPWWALFQSVSAFSNTGMSLVDLSLIPFQRAYLMIFGEYFFSPASLPLSFSPSFTRGLYKLVPVDSRIRESLKFLLDHPRRCFVYLFPSTQTWVLAIVMLVLTLIDWVSFLVLDLGTPTIASIPVGTRVVAGLIQSAAVRAAGFGIVSLSLLAPAVKVLYVIMMYVSVYPIALSVRATNVYEEQSLGLFKDDEGDDLEMKEEGAQAVAKYVGWHARRQLAFDIWWLGFALWVVCIIERGNLDKTENARWFNIFAVIFELVSAYGTVGLSLGVPYDNYSLCGSFRTLSKLVVIAVMLRGRHRGLPVAIDRAVMLPKDFTEQDEIAFEQERSRRLSRRTSSILPDPNSFPSNPNGFSTTRNHVRRGSRGSFTSEPIRNPSDPFILGPKTSVSMPVPHKQSSQTQFLQGQVSQPQTPLQSSPLVMNTESPLSRSPSRRGSGEKDVHSASRRGSVDTNIHPLRWESAERENLSTSRRGSADKDNSGNGNNEEKDENNFEKERGRINGMERDRLRSTMLTPVHEGQSDMSREPTQV
ncbi:hypothetical protein M231_01022 [Tremella mesenterica]|uniref:Potassium transport protein n=1 Tax=Tremella mesenterica TaxID=5217 RepID=A0A4V1M4W5_TREME|nr:hypothetical protein M231_01022 [Tremella mesenterica]